MTVNVGAALRIYQGRSSADAVIFRMTGAKLTCSRVRTESYVSAAGFMIGRINGMTDTAYSNHLGTAKRIGIGIKSYPPPGGYIIDMLDMGADTFNTVS